MSEESEGYQGEAHLFLEPNRTYFPKPKPRGGYPPSDYHVGEEAPPLEEQLEETISSIESKEPFDKIAYFILDLRVPRRHPLVSRFVKILNAKILSEVEENKLLVMSSLGDLKSAKSVFLKRMTFRSRIFKIHHLRSSDIVDPELDLKDTKGKTLTLHLVPNIGFEKASEYVDQIKKYLAERISIQDVWIDRETGDTFLDIFLTEDQLSNVISRFGFIFKVHEKMKVRSIEPMAEVHISDISIEHIDEERLPTLPKICLLDTGINTIPQLNYLIIGRNAEPPIVSFDDVDNHGTSVAILAAYGDTITNQPSPKARIISHKIKEEDVQANIVSALANAINRYSDCNTFNCSMAYQSTRLGSRLTTKKIDAISQRANRLVIFSAGNITPSQVQMAISAGARYPDYLNEAPVYHPSDAPSVLSVGAYTKHSLLTSIAPSDAPSPFTRFGTILRELMKCPKPELVEHGGNWCYTNGRFSCNRVGVITFSNRGGIVEKTGTSFSAPLVSLHLARLWNMFDQIRNSETIKAILLSTCRRTQNHPRYVGFGIPNENELFFSRIGVVRVIFEGTLPLSEAALGTDVIPSDEVKVFVPADVTTIELFLVHSDNYQLSPFPKLNTFLRVVAEKPGKKGSVKPYFGRASSQTHVKYLIYRYKRNIKGDWFFRIIPYGINIPTRERDNVVIRYGGVIKLTAKTPRFRLGDSIMRGLRRGRNIQIPLASSKSESE